jgi:hypothetical protein
LRKKSKHRCAETDEHIRTQTGRTMLPLAFEADEPAQNCGDQQARDGAADKPARQFPPDQIDEMVPGHRLHAANALRMGEFYHSERLKPRLTR